MKDIHCLIFIIQNNISIYGIVGNQFFLAIMFGDDKTYHVKPVKNLDIEVKSSIKDQMQSVTTFNNEIH